VAKEKVPRGSEQLGFEAKAGARRFRQRNFDGRQEIHEADDHYQRRAFEKSDGGT
jgi:hypothetical protein